MGAATFAPAAGAHNATTYTAGKGVTSDGYRFVEGLLTLSASYATGGDTLDLSTIDGGVKNIVRLEVVTAIPGSLFHGAQGWSPQLGTPVSATVIKIRALASTTASAATEIANGVNMTARYIPNLRIVYTS